MKRIILALAALVAFSGLSWGQSLTVATVTRPPFSMIDEGQDTGFSLDLWNEIAGQLGREFSIRRVGTFPEMLGLVQEGTADLAVANISITAEREEVFDFTQPIFESGLQIMAPTGNSGNLSMLKAVFSVRLLEAVAVAMALLVIAGMAMWRLERKSQPYFDMPARKALFPAFWWALNLVVNGGFEERVPTTFLGRLFSVILVVSSLFIVSVFVANVTAVMTVDAISNNINSVNDLYGKSVGTTASSTSSAFLDSRDLKHRTYANLEELFSEFESGTLDAVVFDAPILAFYANNNAGAELVGAPFKRENYGIVLPTGSDLAEPINRILLRLREDGTYGLIYQKWFGDNPDN